MQNILFSLRTGLDDFYARPSSCATKVKMPITHEKGPLITGPRITLLKLAKTYKCFRDQSVAQQSGALPDKTIAFFHLLSHDLSNF